eukprot:2322478-Pleurochrysis_carterae.AAC.1
MLRQNGARNELGAQLTCTQLKVCLQPRQMHQNRPNCRSGGTIVSVRSAWAGSPFSRALSHASLNPTMRLGQREALPQRKSLARRPGTLAESKTTYGVSSALSSSRTHARMHERARALERKTSMCATMRVRQRVRVRGKGMRWKADPRVCCKGGRAHPRMTMPTKSAARRMSHTSGRSYKSLSSSL